MSNRICYSTYIHINTKPHTMRKPNTKTLKTINKLIIAVFLIGSAFLLLACEPDPYYVCYDNFRPEHVIIEGQEITIYHKELICDEY